MRRIVLSLALAMVATNALAQVAQTGSVFANGQWQPPAPTTQYLQSCNGGAGGIVGQGGCTAASNNAFANITTATTTVVKASPGNIHAICLNTLAASGTVTAYDNTAASGTKIFTITNPAALLVQGPVCATYDVAFAIGLTIVTTGVQDITVSYR